MYNYFKIVILNVRIRAYLALLRTDSTFQIKPSIFKLFNTVLCYLLV